MVIQIIVKPKEKAKTETIKQYTDNQQEAAVAFIEGSITTSNLVFKSCELYFTDNVFSYRLFFVCNWWQCRF